MENAIVLDPDKVTSNGEVTTHYSYCSLPATPERVLGPEVHENRASLILLFGNKFVNGTVLRYYFFDKETDGKNVMLANGTKQWRPYTTSEAEKEVVRKAFQIWKGLGIGLEFKEVKSRDEAEIRIGFMRGDGAWSYIGRDIIDLGIGRDDRTMNFGWDLTRQPRELDTALHEIGHTLGFPHEHQNPYAGIVWDEEAVYKSLAQPPNSWSRDKTYQNIIRKIAPDTVQGSNWDPNSVMHYPFEPGMIKEPPQYRNGLTPAGGLSERDQNWVKTFYPALEPHKEIELKVAESAKLNLSPGEQKDFIIKPNASRSYEIRTFGTSDTVMVLFENINGELRYFKGDDDSGEDRNALIKARLRKGRSYVLRIRLYYADRAGETAVMYY
jgi:hypothetical protein